MSLTWIIVIVMGVALQFGGLWCYFASDRYRKSLGVSPRGTRLNLVLPLTEPTETLPAYSASTLPVVFAETDQSYTSDSSVAETTATSVAPVAQNSSRASVEAFALDIPPSASLSASLPASRSETQGEQALPPGYTVVANAGSETE